MARKLPGNVRCSVFYCSIRSCLWALYIWVIFIEIQHTTLQARKSAKDFIFKMQQLHDPFLPSTTSNFSLKRKRRHKTQCRFEYLCFAFSLATEMMWKSSKDWQWIATEICLFFFLVLFLISSCPEENVKDYVPVFAKALRKTELLCESIRVTTAFAIPSRTAGSSGTPIHNPVSALAACQSAGPLTAEMAEVSGARYLCNTTAEQNSLFLRLPMAHTSRKNWTHCPWRGRKWFVQFLKLGWTWQG